jgi:nitroreductase
VGWCCAEEAGVVWGIGGGLATRASLRRCGTQSQNLCFAAARPKLECLVRSRLARSKVVAVASGVWVLSLADI